MTDRLFFGKKNSGITLQRQMQRIIVICCIVAVLAQAVVIIALVMNSFIRNEADDTQYILQSNNESMHSAVRFLEEHIIALQHDSRMTEFFRDDGYDKTVISAQLKELSNLFSESNRQGLQRPLVTEISLFNKRDDCVYNLYYPKTVTLQQQQLAKMHAFNQRFLKQSEPFYYETGEEEIFLCLRLYDDSMQVLGSCAVVLDTGFIRNAYDSLKKYTDYSWEIRTGSGSLLLQTTYDRNAGRFLENERPTGFGLVLSSSVSMREIYKSLRTMLLSLLIVSAIIIAAVTVIGSIIAHRFVRPLETVAEKIKQVGSGDFQTKLGEYSAEELNHISGTFNEMTAQIDRLITEVYEAQLLSQQAQIKYLQAQMSPHFLFNVLSMIGTKAALNRDEEVHKMIGMLSRLLQGKVFRKNEIEITLAEEMEIVEFYLYLQNHRFGDKITYSIAYENETTDAASLLVPRLSIEPLVENAVAHGLEPKEGNGLICVTVSRNAHLTVTITDDGVGFDTENVAHPEEDETHSHVGIMNTDRMIKNLYGNDFGVTVESAVGTGTTVTVRLPVKERIQTDGERDGC